MALPLHADKGEVLPLPLGRPLEGVGLEGSADIKRLRWCARRTAAVADPSDRMRAELTELGLIEGDLCTLQLCR